MAAAAAAAPAGFGGGLGAVIGSHLAGEHLDDAQYGVDKTAGEYVARTAGYDEFGKSFLSDASEGVGDVRAKADESMGWHQFMAGYQNTPAAQYQMQQAEAVQNNSAASRGELLSGENLRALTTMNQGIVAQNANQAYTQYLQGNQQQFGQLETALGNMFSAIGVGQTATGQQASIEAAKIGATANLGQAQAKNDQNKGAGLGSMFNGLGGMPFAF